MQDEFLVSKTSVDKVKKIFKNDYNGFYLSYNATKTILSLYFLFLCVQCYILHKLLLDRDVLLVSASVLEDCLVLIKFVRNVD